MVEMGLSDVPFIYALVRLLGALMLAATVLIHTRYARPAGFVLAAPLVNTAFCVHLQSFFRDYPAEMGEAMVELQRRMSIAGVVKDLGLAGAALIVARLAGERAATGP